jgi:uncharacterized protein (TIGR00369 family)
MPVSEIMTEGPFAGWTRWRGHHRNRFTDLIGAHYIRIGEDGAVECAMPAEDKHLNGLGFLHGGFLMAFIDQVMFAIARPRLSATVGAVTLSCDTHFLGSGVAGKNIHGSGEILRETGKMLFIRGLLTQDGNSVCAFTGTLRKVTRQA